MLAARLVSSAVHVASAIPVLRKVVYDEVLASPRGRFFAGFQPV